MPRAPLSLQPAGPGRRSKILSPVSRDPHRRQGRARRRRPAGERSTPTPARAAGRTTATTSSRPRCTSAAHCGHHFPMPARARIAWLADRGLVRRGGGRRPLGRPAALLRPAPLPRAARRGRAQHGPRPTRWSSARATLDGHPLELAVMDFAFMGGSMGSAVGEKFVARLRRRRSSAARRCCSVSSSGGARMQEGILSLMQLPKTVCARRGAPRRAGCRSSACSRTRRPAARMASFASLGDVTIAEPGALLAFTGPRVVQEHRQGEAPRRLRPLRAEPPLRPDRRHRPPTRAAPVPGAAPSPLCPVRPSARLRERLGRLQEPAAPAPHGRRERGARGSGASSTRLARGRVRGRDLALVELARHQDRPYTLDYVERIIDDWVELHGDRGRTDDGAIVAGIGRLDGRTVALVGHQKGRDLKERLDRQYGMPSPEGYAKAMRVMDLADRFGFPVVTPDRHARRVSGRRGRAARPGRGDRALAGARCSRSRAVGRLRDRRGRLGRRARARRGRPRADAGERDLLGDLAGGLRD